MGNRPGTIEREFKIDLITTAPSVVYDVHLKDGGVIKVDNPSQLPSASELNHIEEPYIRSQDFHTSGICWQHHQVGPRTAGNTDQHGVPFTKPGDAGI